MPELPEVETVRRGLERAIAGKTISKVELRRPDLRWPFPQRMEQRLTGATVEHTGRLGKYMLLGLSSGETLIVHLGMSGSFLEFPAPATVATAGLDGFGDGKHDHVLIWMSGGTRISYRDPRRFGMMDLVKTADVRSHRLLAGLGPEPLGNSFNGQRLHDSLQQRKGAVKTVLLDQKVVAGLGNIYVCEALWHSGILPTRRANSLSPKRVANLAGAVRKVLQEAIDAGGASLRDHRQLNGETGYFQHHFRVYGKESQPCPRDGCRGKIVRLVQAGRSTFHCRRCQS